jgi:hypothetical protein
MSRHRKKLENIQEANIKLERRVITEQIIEKESPEINEGMIDFDYYLNRLRKKLSKEELLKSLTLLKHRISNENKETKEAFNLLVSAMKGEKKLTDEEKTMIIEQLKDVFRMVGLGIITIVPGGFGLTLLLRLINKHEILLPSSFKDKSEI